MFQFRSASWFGVGRIFSSSLVWFCFSLFPSILVVLFLVQELASLSEMLFLWCVLVVMDGKALVCRRNPTSSPFCAVAPLPLSSLPEATLLSCLQALSLHGPGRLRTTGPWAHVWHGHLAHNFPSSGVILSGLHRSPLCAPVLLAYLPLFTLTGVQQQKKLFWKLVFLLTLTGNVKFVVFCALNCDKWLGGPWQYLLSCWFCSLLGRTCREIWIHAAAIVLQTGKLPQGKLCSACL